MIKQIRQKVRCSSPILFLMTLGIVSFVLAGTGLAGSPDPAGMDRNIWLAQGDIGDTNPAGLAPGPEAPLVDEDQDDEEDGDVELELEETGEDVELEIEETGEDVELELEETGDDVELELEETDGEPETGEPDSQPVEFEEIDPDQVETDLEPESREYEFEEIDPDQVEPLGSAEEREPGDLKQVVVPSYAAETDTQEETEAQQSAEAAETEVPDMPAGTGTAEPEEPVETAETEPAAPETPAKTAEVETTEPASPAETMETDAAGVAVRVDKGNVRVEPSITAPILSQLVEGDRVKLVEKQGEWYRVQLPEGETGWAHQTLFAAAGMPFTITVDRANVRAEPSLEAEVKTRLSHGDVVNILQTGEEWYQVQLSGGDTGWIHQILFAAEIPARQQEPARLKAIRIEAGGPGEEKVYFLYTGETPPNTFFTHTGPTRIVCDFPNTRLADSIQPFNRISGELIQNVRIAFRGEDRSDVRVVFDMKPDRQYRLNHFFLEEKLYLIVFRTV